MRGLPARTRLKLLEQDPTPSLDATVSLAQRFGALDTEHFAANSTAHLSTGENDPPEIPDMSILVAAVKALQVEQPAHSQRDRTTATTSKTSVHHQRSYLL